MCNDIHEVNKCLRIFPHSFLNGLAVVNVVLKWDGCAHDRRMFTLWSGSFPIV